MLSQTKNFILDTLFPTSCLCCRKEGVWLCRKCMDKMEMPAVQVCPYCEKIETEKGRVCPACRSGFFKKGNSAPLDGLIAAVKYKKGNISKIVHLFKYRFIEDLGNPLGELMIRSLLAGNVPLPDLIVPVPLHPRRLRWRGFNQAGVLSRCISKGLAPGFAIPVADDLLIRRKFTAPQMKIKNYRERKNNMAGAFSAKDSDLPGIEAGSKNILLVDDVCTTGATLLECAGVLKNIGAESVVGAVIARQEIAQG